MPRIDIVSKTVNSEWIAASSRMEGIWCVQLATRWLVGLLERQCCIWGLGMVSFAGRWSFSTNCTCLSKWELMQLDVCIASIRETMVTLFIVPSVQALGCLMTEKELSHWLICCLWLLGCLMPGSWWKMPGECSDAIQRSSHFVLNPISTSMYCDHTPSCPWSPVFLLPCLPPMNLHRFKSWPFLFHQNRMVSCATWSLLSLLGRFLPPLCLQATMESSCRWNPSHFLGGTYTLSWWFINQLCSCPPLTAAIRHPLCSIHKCWWGALLGATVGDEMEARVSSLSYLLGLLGPLVPNPRCTTFDQRLHGSDKVYNLTSLILFFLHL